MSTTLDRPSIIDIIKREWWLVLLTAVIAVVVAYLASSSGQDEYVARSAVVIDSYNISQFKGIPTPDELITEGKGALAPNLAKAVGTDEATVKDAMAMTVVGNPPRRLVITYRATDEQTALKGAVAVAKEISAYSTSRAQLEIDRQKAIIGQAETALTRLGAPNAQNAFEINSLENTKINAKTTLDILSTIYTLEGQPSVEKKSAQTGKRDSLMAGVLVGIVLGIVLAVAREAYLRYRVQR